jgi:hypothetical protein
MLLCFGVAWPFSIFKSYMSRSTKGKSPVFLFIILAGYIAGIANKVLCGIDIVIVFYCLNFVLVAIDILLFFRNKMLMLRNRDNDCNPASAA